MTLGKRIKAKREELKMTQSKLAELVGIRQPTLSDLEKGINSNTTKILEIANALDVTPEWLMYGEGKSIPTTLDVTPIPNTVSLEKPSDNVYVPVISWVAAGSFCNIETVPIDDLIKWVPCPVPHSKNTFALKVVGVSMENPNGKPSFEDGDIIYVDPEREPENKSFVVVTLDGSSQATFKQLIIELDGKYIQPLNPNWHEQIIKINDDATINGTVIGKWTDI